MDAAFARTVWQVLEPLHAVTYFAPESREANRAVGLRGFWMGYFAARAAPLGVVAAGVVEVAFANFHPAMVRRAIPTAWGYATPEAVLRARAEAATAALRRVAPSAEAAAVKAVPLLERAVAAADGAGRPLFAANRDLLFAAERAPSPTADRAPLPAADHAPLPAPDHAPLPAPDPDLPTPPPPHDPVAALWQAVTALREHRGDGHVAVLTAEGLDGCEAHLLLAACEGVPAAVLRDNRGWSEEDWQAAADRLTARGLLEGGRHPTAEGRGLRAHIEARTDALAARPYRALTQADATRLLDLLGPPSDQVLTSGTIPFPNPMGLPDRRETNGNEREQT